MRVIRAIEPLLNLAEPLTSPFLALAMVLLLPLVVRRVRGVGLRVAILSGSVLLFGAAYHLAAQNAAAARWLAALNTPLVAVFLVIILPAMYLPRGRAYRFFLLLPAACVLLAVLGVMDAYRSVPPGKEGFYWFLVRPAYFMGGIASALVLLEPVLSLKWFRFAVRTACALALIYGGFAFRRDYSDYQAMLARRPQAKAARNLLNLSETSPVLRSDERMTYLPSAPCRFTADGGYVQGCNLELFQRMMMVNYGKLFTKDPDPAMTSQMRLLLGALVLLLATCFMAGRWFCGWVCPLSAIGGVLDFLRRTFRLPHFKPTVRMKKIYVYVGLGAAVLGLLLSAGFAYVGEDGKFAGVKIPQYPFCKICPSERVCPVVAGGPGAYTPFATSEWGFGFFRYASIALLIVFLASFATARRFWCRMCPMGMISGVFNRGGMFRLVKEPQKCNGCGICTDVCPMDIDSVRAETEGMDVSSYDCVLCLRCVEKCPRDGCLSLEFGGRKVTESRFDVRVR